MQTTTREWIIKTVRKLPEKEIEPLKDYLEFLVWKNKNQKKTGKTQAQRIIEVMEQPPHLTHEDVEALRQAIEEGKRPMKFDSPFNEPEGK